MVSVCAIVLIVIGALFVGVGGFLGYYLFPRLVNEQIEETVKLIEGTEAYERWEELPIPMVFKVYFFNVSNPDEVQSGGKPVLREIGPYVYNRYNVKVNITQDDVDELSYYQNSLFEFDTNASYPLTESDDITIAHLPMMSVFTVAENINSIIGDAQMILLNNNVPTIFGNPTNTFLETTPRDFLFDGVYLMCNESGTILNIVCNRIEANTPIFMPRLDDGRFKFSLFSHKNNTHEGHFTVNSGVRDVSQLGEILRWEGSSTVDVWTEGSTCNDIVGSDASIFPPFRTPESNNSIFNVDICRSVQLEYSRQITYAGIKGNRFIVGEDMLASPSTRSENECFCIGRTLGITGSDGCLLDGAMEIWDCVDAPVVVTFPHFYLADEQYQNGVEGLSPDASLHQIFVDLEPNTGTPLRGSKRVQFNIFYRPINRISLTTNLNTTLMPILWIDEGIELNDELIKVLNTSLFDILEILDIIYISLMIGGAVICVIGIIWLIVSCCKTKKNPES